MFKFNFGDASGSTASKETEDKSHPQTSRKRDSEGKGKTSKKKLPEAKEHFLSETHLDLLGESCSINEFTYGSGCHTILHLEPDDEVRREGAAAAAAAQHSDLVPGVYEGGLKVWECSRDLTEYLTDEEEANSLNLRGMRVLEVGCGAGLPGLHCLKSGAHVDFQDFNSDVVERLTIPNVLLNAPETEEDGGTTPVTRFISGDWADLFSEGDEKSLLKPQRYDLILTSETIYSLDSQPKLLSLLDHCLSEGGRVLLAAKVHYFGVGGGLRQFEGVVEETGKWRVRSVKTKDEGVKREVIELRKKLTEN